MGASGSRESDGISGGLKAEYQSSLKLFNKNERSELEKSFDAICATDIQTAGGISSTTSHKYKGFTLTHLQKFIGSKLPLEITKRLFNQMWLHQGAFKQPEDAFVSKEAFIVTLGKAIKGTPEEQSHIIVYLSTDKDASKGIARSDMRKLVSDLLKSYENLLEEQVEHKRGWRLSCTDDDNQRFINYIMREITEESSTDDTSLLTEAEVQSWLHHTAMFQLLLTHVLFLCFSQAKPEPLPETSDSTVDFSLSQPSLIPVCQDIPWDKTTSLLYIPSLVLLNRHLPHQLRLQWRFLYSSAMHGASFATFLSHIRDKGPMVILVKDSGGHIFGSFVSESVGLGPSFTGAAQCFLFQLSPNLGIYESSGKNENYAYLNIDQQTLPNGLGMGGQLYHFGFWLSQDFGKGHSKGTPKCTTFDSPQLSSNEEFEFDVLEVWALGPPAQVEKVDPDAEEGISESILDKDPEAQAILELAGKERKSEGLREQEADIPEVHSLPPM